MLLTVCGYSLVHLCLYLSRNWLRRLYYVEYCTTQGEFNGCVTDGVNFCYVVLIYIQCEDINVSVDTVCYSDSRASQLPVKRTLRLSHSESAITAAGPDTAVHQVQDDDG